MQYVYWKVISLLPKDLCNKIKNVICAMARGIAVIQSISSHEQNLYFLWIFPQET